jgi:hypothetical protein
MMLQAAKSVRAKDRGKDEETVKTQGDEWTIPEEASPLPTASEPLALTAVGVKEAESPLTIPKTTKGKK